MELEAIQKKARLDLQLCTAEGEPDFFLWEHSVRVAENARRIAAFSEVKRLQADDLAVYLAGLYHDAGWALQVRQGETDRLLVLTTPTTRVMCEQAACAFEQSLSGAVSPGVIERAARAIRSRHDRDAASAEAQILSEAEALDEFGVLPIWILARRASLEGRSLDFAIEGWRRKQEYHFWTARLRDAFRFDSVRDIARRRLERFERFVGEIELENGGQDVVQTVAHVSGGRVGSG